MIDAHTHILPAMDDGSRDVETSRQMLRLMYDQGARIVAATPHFDAETKSVRDFCACRENAWNALREKMEQPMPAILLGAEVRYFTGLSVYPNLGDLCLSGTNCILLEMPFGVWSKSEILEMRRIQSVGFQIILAHVNRYPVFRSPSAMRSLAEQGLYTQCNTEAFLHLGDALRAQHYLKNGWIHILGSDAHNMDTRRPNMDQAANNMRKLLGSALTDSFFDANYEILGVNI